MLSGEHDAKAPHEPPACFRVIREIRGQFFLFPVLPPHLLNGAGNIIVGPVIVIKGCIGGPGTGTWSVFQV